jgi:hypothetical protein
LVEPTFLRGRGRTQVSRWQRMGLRRPPVATAMVFVVTAAVAALVLLAARDLHGAAMVAGMAIGAAVTGAIWGPCGWRRRGG